MSAVLVPPHAVLLLPNNKLHNIGVRAQQGATVFEALTARHRHYWANFLQTQAIREKASAHMTGASAISVQCKKALLLSPGVI